MGFEENLEKYGKESAQAMRPAEQEATKPNPIPVPPWVSEWKSMADDLATVIRSLVDIANFTFEPSVRVTQGIDPVKPSSEIIVARIEMTRPIIKLIESTLGRLEGHAQ